ncbi:diacylglycerol/lipid kinase family protein [Pseudomonas asuensis]|uniref:DAGKc domain-containing protein n=1 Tax=Pseudomonas asuensis TaxID=1825787 RepID=A0ABQ2GMC4_9PSED|nr:acylglycerol kinase family protein [Pseudomonas asuensis]GGM01541.1 hypothetical protein GCM10009425_10980 [Pseudomonas asuensis]
MNPLSGRVRRRLQPLRALIATLPGAMLHEASAPADIVHVLLQWQESPPELVVVIGGDGTLQAVLTALLQAQPVITLPALVIVAGGTTNMSAADLGTRAKPEVVLKALNAWLNGNGAPPRQQERAVLKVDGDRVNGSQYGMFFGTGAILSGVRYFHQHVRPTGVRGALGPALAFVRMLFSLLRNKPHPLLPATPASLRTDTDSWSSSWLLVLASTLDNLLIGCRPYWGTESAPMHFTAVEHQPRRLMRVLPFLLCGRGRSVAHERDGYISRNLNRLSLEGSSHFLLDGEQFEADSPIRLSTTAPLRFLTY